MELIRRHTDYALRALVYLAARGGEVVSASDIARTQDIPIGFLQKILQRLVKSGLVASHRGVQGGYSLARDPGSVTVLDVVEIIQGKPAMNRCLLGREKCSRELSCPLRHTLLDIQEQVARLMSRMTLRELVGEWKPQREQQE